MRQREWSSLAVVPSHPGLDVHAVANVLAATGRLHGERSVSVIDATGTQLSSLGRVTAAITAAVEKGDLVLVPVDAVSINPTTSALVRATSGGLLVVRLGDSELSSTRDLIELLGRERLVGSVVLDAELR
jgi:hypothetical protein